MNNSSPVSLKNLAERILSNSVQLGFHIAAAESLTGGLLADAFVCYSFRMPLCIERH